MTPFRKRLVLVLLSVAVSLVAGPPARAGNCSSPIGKEAALIYNADYHTYQFCNGTNWVPLGPVISAGAGDTAFITGELLSSTLRNDQSTNVGFQVVIGASDITVTQLGRWVVSGNSQSHTLYVFNNSCSVVASVAVNTSGAPAGASP